MLGVMLTLIGIVDAVGVVRATSTQALSEPPQNFGAPSSEVEDIADRSRSGFLPVHVLRENGTNASVAVDPRLQAELDGVQDLISNRSNLSLLPITPEPPPEIPQSIWIPAIDLYAPILPMDVEVVDIDGVEYDQWTAPNEFAAGWHADSAPLGQGNTVLNGHHNIYGEVFRYLVDLKEGDEIIVYSDNLAYRYSVRERVIFPERFAKPEQRVQNAELVHSTDDERLTLITCWPYESNTHRLVLVAKPVPLD